MKTPRPRWAAALTSRPLAVIVLLGAVARLWALGAVPAGLNPDEVSIAYDAWSLLHFGVDRNGQPWPIHLISWGSGQNALYAYFSAPFLLGGTSPLTIRLCQVVVGIATLPLVYRVAARIFDRRVGLVAAAMVAFSPWHVMLSRWALESNLVVGVFLAGFACLLVRRAWGLPVGAALLGLSLYAYGSAYVAAPLMLAMAIGVGWRSGAIAPRAAILAGAIFAVVALPIALFVASNSLHGPALAIGPMTVPHLPSVPRYETQAAIGENGWAATLAKNFARLIATVLGEVDKRRSNVIPPFGIFYHLLPLLALGGIVAMVRDRVALDRRRLLLLGWIVACIPIGLIQHVNVNRINLIFVPLLICAAFAVVATERRWRLTWLMPAAGAALAIAFSAFSLSYLRVGRAHAIASFDAGLMPAIAAAGPGRLCVSGRPDMAYIYALLADRTNPRRFAASVRYADPHASFRRVISFDRFVFGLGRCARGTAAFVLAPGDRVPAGAAVVAVGDRYRVARPIAQ